MADGRTDNFETKTGGAGGGRIVIIAAFAAAAAAKDKEREEEKEKRIGWEGEKVQKGEQNSSSTPQIAI